MDGSNTEFVFSQPGQSLYLQYRPSALMRGLPADTITWEVIDQWGESSALSSIDIDIRCSPGHFFEEAAPSFCMPCPAGQYNLPDAEDQVRRWFLRIFQGWCRSLLAADIEVASPWRRRNAFPVHPEHSAHLKLSPVSRNALPDPFRCTQWPLPSPHPPTPATALML